jgi:hypothetical protein
MEALMTIAPQQKPAITVPGVVEKTILASIVGPEKAQISVHAGADLYREIRVENFLRDANGKKLA